MKHKLHKCNDSDCFTCEGGLAYCEVCKGAEGDLTTDCCGRPITTEESDLIYKKGTLDFKDGKWIQKHSLSKER